MRVRYQQLYYDSVVPKLKKQFDYSSVMHVPKLEKIIISTGLGRMIADTVKMEHAVDAVSFIAGQRACYTLAKKSVAAFKVRQGMRSGLMVTLRRERMYEFLERLRNVVLPRMRDFRGFDEKSLNGNSMSFGIKDYTVFPEIRELMKTTENIGLNITFVVNKCYDPLAFKALLVELGFPFKE